MGSLSRFLWLLVGLGLGLYLALTLWLGFLGLSYPYQLDYGEGIVLWFAQELARGHSIYRLPGFPYASSNYPPVAMLLSAALMPILGDGYAAGRLLNFASALIVAALVYRIVKIETRNWRAAAIAGLFFVGSPYIYDWVPLFRADLIGLAFAFGGVYCIWEYGRRSSVTSRQAIGYLALGILSFLLALFTKQTLIAAPAAAFLAIFLRDKRTALAFAVGLGAIGGGIYLAIDAATGGGFTFGLITSNATVFLPEQLLDLLQRFGSTFPILLFLAAWGWVVRVRARRIGVLEWYALTSLATLGMAGRVGAWENYFFEAITAMCVFGGLQIADGRWLIADSRWQIADSAIRSSQFGSSNLQPLISNLQSQISNLLLPVLLILQLVLLWHDPRVAADLVARDLAANQSLAELLARTPGTVISEDMGALVTSGKEVAYYTFQYSSLARSGKWDQRWELDGLRGGEFPLVILERGTREDVDHYRRFTREFVSALDESYAHTQDIGKYEVYTPSPLAHFQRADFGDDLAMVGWNTDQNESPRALQVTIVWQAKRVMAQRLKAFVQLVKEDGSKVTQDDHEPRNGIYPTTRWAVDEMVRELYTLELPKDAALGEYAIKVGWYDSDTGDRLPVAGSVDNSVTLTAHGAK